MLSQLSSRRAIAFAIEGSKERREEKKREETEWKDQRERDGVSESMGMVKAR